MKNKLKRIAASVLTLALLAVPVLAHRVILRGLYGKSGEGERFIEELLQKTPVPTEQRA